MTDSSHTSHSDQRRDRFDQLAHSTAFDPETDSASEEVVCAVSALEDVEPRELDFLSNAVDPDALDSLLRADPEGPRSATDTKVEFEYEGYHVLASAEGTIALDAIDGSSDQ